MMEGLREHGFAVVTRDLPAQRLCAGDVGVVVHIHRRAGERAPVGYMLETFTVEGESLDVVSVPADAVRPTTEHDVASARPAAAE
jgi:pyruvate/2-oxoglutarate dehydrogenase complex dihydrolipoamide acyltransferase (E2) component